MTKRTPIRGEDGFDVYAAMGYEYLGTVEVEMPDASSTATLELRFWGSPTDHVWNHRTALEFYTPLIEREGLRVLAYGVQGIGPREDLLVEATSHVVNGHWRWVDGEPRWIDAHVREGA